MIVQDGFMSLQDKPGRYLPFWTNDPSDPRGQITLHHLLSFTSGLWSQTPGTFMSFLPGLSLDDKTREVYTGYAGQTSEPGVEFAYATHNLMVVGAMAESATGRPWQEMFDSYVSGPFGMQDMPYYGSFEGPLNTTVEMMISARDYSKFLYFLLQSPSSVDSPKPILGDDLRSKFFSDQSRDAVMKRTLEPSMKGLITSSQWHYSYGHWVECSNPDWSRDCAEGHVVQSSMGAAGFYPLIRKDPVTNASHSGVPYYAIVVPQDPFDEEGNFVLPLSEFFESMPSSYEFWWNSSTLLDSMDRISSCGIKFTC
mmetsp:Transcript_37710/g.58869  ORF Transcript_37710/g.58869 Transcript_37710/m.58869 type:complete len:311 (+) Transcript_37710:409-1341(+)